jgi:hypothetical protein
MYATPALEKAEAGGLRHCRKKKKKNGTVELTNVLLQ